MTMLFAFLVLVFVVIPVLRLLWPNKSSAKRKGDDGECRVAKEIERVGFSAVHDIYLPSKHGTTQIDHVAKIGNAIVVMETKNYAGAIYGTAKERDWRQVFRKGKSFSFPSPINQNKGHVDAVRDVVGPEADVRSLVVFAGDAKFPKGVPEGVVRFPDLAQRMREIMVDAGKVGSVHGPWDRLMLAIDMTDRRQAKADHADTLDRRVPGRQPKAKKGERRERIEPTF